MSMDRLPVFDPLPEIEALWSEINASVQRVLRSGSYILGSEVEAFEKEVASLLGVKHAVAVNSGTDALLIALRAVGMQPGDEVIVPAFTFVATASAVMLGGARPVFADIDLETFNLAPASVKTRLSPRTRAVVPVHLFGHPVDMDGLDDVLPEGVHVVEDVAQAFGAQWGGRRLGSFGRAGAFSFFPTKNLGAVGDGGLVATGEDAVADAARTLRAHGARTKYENEILGYNSRLDALQAAILRVKLPRVEEANRRRREAASRYRSLLGGIPGITLPVERTGALHVFHQFTIRVHAGRRNALQKSLADAGIATAVYYPTPLHRLPLFAKEAGTAFGVAEEAAQEVLSLPIWPDISAGDQERVAAGIRRALS